MNRQALFSDCTPNYVTPAEPKAGSTLTIRFRTVNGDADRVRLLVDNHKYNMELEKQTELFDYYKIDYTLGDKPLRYYFEVSQGTDICQYHRMGTDEMVKDQYPFEIVPGFSTPDWAKGAVMYQIFVDRFYNGDETNDVVDDEYYYIGGKSVRVRDWSKPPANVGIREFYGGDLQGVMDKLDYLQDLGVEVLYLNPIFVSPSNHKYDIQDYDYVDPHYGKIVEDGGEVLDGERVDNHNASKYQIRTTDKANLEASNQLLIQLVEEVHARGMKIILDGVFNHCGSFNKWMDRERIYEDSEDYEKGAYVSKQSPYHSFFHFHKACDENWPYNGSYDGWWGHDTLPKLNFEDSEELENYILEIGRKWVSPPYNVDGWRLDVAADLGRNNEYNHYFWNKFREAVKGANPEAIILAEHYGNPQDWLRGDEWDTIMNYDAFMEPLTWFFTGMEKHSDWQREDLEGNADHFAYSMGHHMSLMLYPSLFTSMNQLSNHDHSRFLTRTNHKKGRIEHWGPAAANDAVMPEIMREAVVMQMTWPGAPTIYYGDEVGLCGFTDPDNRRTYPWGGEDMEMLEFHKDIIRIHKQESALREGSIYLLQWNYNLIVFARMTAEEQILVVVHHGDSLKTVRMPVWYAEVPPDAKMERLIYTYDRGYTIEPEEYRVRDGVLYVNMGARSALVLKTVK